VTAPPGAVVADPGRGRVLVDVGGGTGLVVGLLPDLAVLPLLPKGLPPVEGGPNVGG